ncbi:MAG: Trk family potassium uptake protein [Ruminococcaceae bacterium]|nr:Trk family potassium uptake protein [Oscillospiraceae bacterium]
MSFVLVILVGAFLLTLPFSSTDNTSTPFINALFTATSASCVTGLVVYDTFTHWSLFGQTVILLLIQIGGLGLMSALYMIFFVRNKNLGLKEKELVRESFSPPAFMGVKELSKTIILGTFFFELLGAIFLSVRFVPEFGLFRGIYYSIFHSISAFCNAGFDLMGIKQPGSSLNLYYDDILVNITIIMLIVIGGLGFYVWSDIAKNRHHVSKYSLHTKIVLTSTLLLIAIPAAIIFVIEYFGGSFSELSLKGSVLSSVFQSVTLRTAGFTTVDYTLLNDGIIMIMLVVMLVGGSPGSTAGGIKTTTFSVLVLSISSVLKNREAPECFGRRLELNALKKAAAILIVYVALVITGIVILCFMDDVTLKEAAFECVSATATVGLTLGITSSLSVISKITVILLMFFGRIGCLSMILALSKTYRPTSAQKPLEKIAIG